MSSGHIDQRQLSSIHHYKLLKTIGTGQFGFVKLALHQPTGHKVAIKIIQKNTLDENTLQMVMREVIIMKLLNHPNIIKLYEVLDTESSLFIVMEYAEGGQVMDFIVTHGRLKERYASRLFRQIVAAIDYCHEAHVIHRDLKAENLLLGSQFDVKLIDFGFSNIWTPGELRRTFCGSPTHTAPELIKRKEYEGPEADIWSLGVLLYVLVCGRLPFDGSSFQELFTKIISGVYTIPDHLSLTCRDLINRMLVVDPEQRATISQIRMHPWIRDENGNPIPKANPLSTSQPMSEDEMDQSVLAELNNIGFSTQSVVESVLNNSYNSAAGSYYLLVDARRKAQTAAKPPTNESNLEKNVENSSKHRRHHTVGTVRELMSLAQTPLSKPQVNHHAKAAIQREPSPGSLQHRRQPSQPIATQAKPTATGNVIMDSEPYKPTKVRGHHKYVSSIDMIREQMHHNAAKDKRNAAADAYSAGIHCNLINTAQPYPHTAPLNYELSSQMTSSKISQPLSDFRSTRRQNEPKLSYAFTSQNKKDFDQGKYVTSHPLSMNEDNHPSLSATSNHDHRPSEKSDLADSPAIEHDNAMHPSRTNPTTTIKTMGSDHPRSTSQTGNSDVDGRCKLPPMLNNLILDTADDSIVQESEICAGSRALVVEKDQITTNHGEPNPLKTSSDFVLPDASMKPNKVEAVHKENSFVLNVKKLLGVSTSSTNQQQQPSKSRFPINKKNTSTDPPNVIVLNILHVLEQLGLSAINTDSPFCIRTTTRDKVQLEIEVCQLLNLNLNGVRFRRICGNGWKYIETCQKILDSLGLKNTKKQPNK